MLIYTMGESENTFEREDRYAVNAGRKFLSW